MINLGSPDSTSIPDVKKYLDEFLMDKRVIGKSYLFRWILVKLIILNTRPRKSAKAYKKIIGSLDNIQVQLEVGKSCWLGFSLIISLIFFIFAY